MSGPLNLLYLPIPVFALTEFAQRYRTAGEDRGYMVHAALVALFGEAAPKPFTITGETSGRISVYAYADVDLKTLTEIRDPVSRPDVDRLIDWSTAADKPMPVLPAGSRFKFSIRICPTVRLGRQPVGAHASGSEVDAFIVARERWEADGKNELTRPERANVYADWLTSAVERQSGAAVEAVRLSSFRMGTTLRKAEVMPNARRRIVRQSRPVAEMEGLIRITDPDAFTGLLARGIGRHRAFGFGMLLLRRA